MNILFRIIGVTIISASLALYFDLHFMVAGLIAFVLSVVVDFIYIFFL